jgi:hypothetical protein
MKEDLRKKIQAALNSVSAENNSNTPDFILAEYLTDCLVAYDKAVTTRARWYGRMDVPGGRLETLVKD